MGNIYRDDSQRLYELLDKASAGEGATMLIPDLQRPYVWTPNQVTLLVDSLIRGWPFGTLLLWKVRHEELHGIPFRPFWTLVNRTTESNGSQITQMNPPAEYHMVLDGQQRVQSLLLAFGSDDWGFVLEDREWIEETKEQRTRGRQAKYRHWSKASLCFDLSKFIDEYIRANRILIAVDFTKILTWVIIDPQSGQSKFPKPDNYKPPLELAFEPKNQRRFIRLSRLWREAQPNPGLKESQFQNIVKPLLEQHGLPPENVEKLLQPMGELMTTLRDVKLSDVSFLELQPFDSQIWSPETYNDAVVSIFTRLNTAGRTLTREEITLAWLKVGWKTDLTDGKSAGDCFVDLRSGLIEQGVTLEIDELVRVASFAWSVSCNDGRLLANSDLLKGDVIRPMALALSQRWASLQESFLEGAKILAQRGFEYGPQGQFSSLYALAVLWAWVYVAKIWQAGHPLGELDKDDYEKRCSTSLDRYIDRWVMCSQWAGVWSGASSTTIEAYASSLSELLKNLKEHCDLSQAHRAWEKCFGKFVDDLVLGASNQMNDPSVPTRERVGQYKNLLWIWHRLDLNRWEKSQVQLRVGKKKPTIEVDHVVSFVLWNDKLDLQLPKDSTDKEEAVALANKLGNCVLLEKNFNISKGKKSFKSFLSQVHEVIEEKLRIDAWCAALAISHPLLDPDLSSVEDLRESIDIRDKEMKDELIEFVRGTRVRADVPTPSVQSATTETLLPLSGWTEAFKLESVNQEVSALVEPSRELEETEQHGQNDQILPRTQADVIGLRIAYRDDENIRLIVDHFGTRQRNQKVTEIDSLVDTLRRTGTPLSRSAILHSFRSLDALMIGRFIPGRKGRATRFEWYEKSLSVRSLAVEENFAFHKSSGA